MIDYADIIKSRVTMQDVVERYTGQRIVLNRICCPVHNGTDRNMRIYQRSYYCWVCHASGDVIQFVQSVMGISFRDAMQRINEDFGLGLPIGEGRPDLNRSDLNRINREIAQRRLADQLAKIDSDLQGIHAANMAGLQHAVEIICRTEQPKTADDEWRTDWCDALRIRTILNEQVY